jgi:TetR/AcrR family transcriptional regulator, repressor of fatR-cypB operon
VKLKDPDKIQLIYKATLTLVSQNGLTSLNMAAIGKQAKLGMGTIYVYFKSKEELINSLFLSIKQESIDRLYAVFDINAPFKLNLKALFDNYIKQRLAYFEANFFIEQCHHSHYLNKDARALDESAYTQLYMILDQGKKELLIKDIDNAFLTSHMIGAANEIVNLAMTTHLKVNKFFLDQAFMLCWDGIKK